MPLIVFKQSIQISRYVNKETEFNPSLQTSLLTLKLNDSLLPWVKYVTIFEFASSSRQPSTWQPEHCLFQGRNSYNYSRKTKRKSSYFRKRFWKSPFKDINFFTLVISKNLNFMKRKKVLHAQSMKEIKSWTNQNPN